VAEALELSEDAVKQRLARGRKLLQEKVQAFVENTLRRTAPGQAFSGAVFAALPLAAGPAATAGVGMGAKGTAAAKSGVLATWLAPFLGFFAGFAAQWMVIRATTPKHERRAKLLILTVIMICVLGSAVLGETSVRSLGRHFAWSDRTRFASVAGFWGFYTIVLATWIISIFRREMAMRLRSEEAVETPRQAVSPLTPCQSAFVVAGTHLMMFSWLISLTWRNHDRTMAVVIAGAMLVLGVWNFFQLRGKTGVAAARAAYGHMTLCCAAVAAVINLRLDVWAAAWYGVSVAEVHSLLPFWIVPLLTLALAAWIGAVLALTRAKPRLGQ
jgi:hypothetical protein